MASFTMNRPVGHSRNRRVRPQQVIADFLYGLSVSLSLSVSLFSLYSVYVYIYTYIHAYDKLLDKPSGSPGVYFAGGVVTLTPKP